MDTTEASQEASQQPHSVAETGNAEQRHQDAVLKIRTAVAVVLAEKKEPLSTILSLGPGAMVTFDTHCDKPLELSIGGHVIATGETVKIGDKFGLRIREVGPPAKD